jgi:hypothetical protein
MNFLVDPMAHGHQDHEVGCPSLDHCWLIYWGDCPSLDGCTIYINPEPLNG